MIGVHMQGPFLILSAVNPIKQQSIYIRYSDNCPQQSTKVRRHNKS